MCDLSCVLKLVLLLSISVSAGLLVSCHCLLFPVLLMFGSCYDPWV